MNATETLLIAPEAPGDQTVQVRVVKVFDGDGFLANIDVPDWRGLRGNSKAAEISVRLGFIDAPEMDQPGGREAKDFLTSLIGGKTLHLVVLTKMDTDSSFDAHGRILCVPYLTHSYPSAEFQVASDCRHKAVSLGGDLDVTRNIELELVLNGWAWVVERYGPDKRYLEALRDAQAHRRGIWASDKAEAPWAFKHRHRKSKTPERQMDFMASLEPSEPCPINECLGYQVPRSGKYGDFVGCSRYPACRYSRS